jgi:pyridoxine 5'-phosphate synthase PdxJ
LYRYRDRGETTPAARDLQRLRHGAPAEQDILGLVAAARGGLSRADLAELTNVPDLGEYEIGRILQEVSGRDLRLPEQPLAARHRS